MSALDEPEVIGAIIGGAVVLLTFGAGAMIAQLSAATERRREQYSGAYRDLVAWTELPYRIRRRTGDGPRELEALASHIHDLQERLACHVAWTCSDSPMVGRWYAAALSGVKARVAPAIEAAWTSPPIAGPADMMIGDLGAACARELEFAADAVAYPFGFRRLNLVRQAQLEDRASVVRSSA